MKKKFFFLLKINKFFFQLNKKNRKKNRPTPGLVGIIGELIEVFYEKKK